MANGFRVRNAQTGEVTVDMTTKLTKVLGTYTTSSSAGSMTDPGFAAGNPFFVILGSQAPNDDSRTATLTAHANSISWDFVDAGNSNKKTTFLYGVYS